MQADGRIAVPRHKADHVPIDMRLAVLAARGPYACSTVVLLCSAAMRSSVLLPLGFPELCRTSILS